MTSTRYWLQAISLYSPIYLYSNYIGEKKNKTGQIGNSTTAGFSGNDRIQHCRKCGKPIRAKNYVAIITFLSLID